MARRRPSKTAERGGALARAVPCAPASAMASDQQALPVPVPVLPNPNPTAPADLTPPSASAARKLPIKRRSLRSSSSPPSSSSPASSDPLRVPAPGGGGGSDQQQPPFKFQRIWSESDELRFLQGLLGCGTQGCVFPHDLNVFYDRFSESMPQPYTRAQLSEKLRRLKNKFCSMSARVAGGIDPACLAPHDRGVLHLCSRLWGCGRRRSSGRTEREGCSRGAEAWGRRGWTGSHEWTVQIHTG
jgi:hypothetical protein